MGINTYMILQRDECGEDYTYGRLIFGDFTCETLEDEYREVKVEGETRIPAGTYEIKLRTEGRMNERYCENPRVSGIHMGMLWLQDVPNFQFVYIHVGNDPEDTEGCILVGKTRGKYRGMPAIFHSWDAYIELYKLAVGCLMAGDRLFITIEDPVT